MSRRRRRRHRNILRRTMRPVQVGCTTKQRFHDEAEGQVEIDRIESRVVYIGGKSPWGRLGVYHCRRCSYFHIGHSKEDHNGRQE